MSHAKQQKFIDDREWPKEKKKFNELKVNVPYNSSIQDSDNQHYDTLDNTIIDLPLTIFKYLPFLYNLSAKSLFKNFLMTNGHPPLEFR